MYVDINNLYQGGSADQKAAQKAAWDRYMNDLKEANDICRLHEEVYEMDLATWIPRAVRVAQAERALREQRARAFVRVSTCLVIAINIAALLAYLVK